MSLRQMLEEIKHMRAAIAALIARVEALEARKPVGRPPKAKDAD